MIVNHTYTPHHAQNESVVHNRLRMNINNDKKKLSGLTGIRTRGLSHFSYQIARLLTPSLISIHGVIAVMAGKLTKRQSYH
jgi:hypothetical protein